MAGERRVTCCWVRERGRRGACVCRRLRLRSAAGGGSDWVRLAALWCRCRSSLCLHPAGRRPPQAPPPARPSPPSHPPPARRARTVTSESAAPGFRYRLPARASRHSSHGICHWCSRILRFTAAQITAEAALRGIWQRLEGSGLHRDPAGAGGSYSLGRSI